MSIITLRSDGSRDVFRTKRPGSQRLRINVCACYFSGKGIKKAALICAAPGIVASRKSKEKRPETHLIPALIFDRTKMRHDNSMTINKQHSFVTRSNKGAYRKNKHKCLITSMFLFKKSTCLLLIVVQL
jgi:hypothetical protein